MSSSRLGLVAAPLRVADDDPVGQPDEHRRGDLAGVGALQLVVDVLGADADAGSDSARASRTAASETYGGQMTRMTPSTRVRAAIVGGQGAGVGGVVFIFQLPAMIDVAHRRHHARADRPRTARERRSPRRLGRRQPLEPLERPLDGRAMDLEALGELGQARLRGLAPRLGDAAARRRAGRQPPVRLERVDRIELATGGADRALEVGRSRR